MADARAGSARAVLVAGSLVVAISLGVRHSFGLFLDPVSMANGWGRETFAFAIALQNLVWGIGQPFAGLAADRLGAGRIVLLGAVLYVAGLVLMAQPLGALGFVLAAGVFVGLGLAGTTFPIVFGAVGRAMPPEKRSLAFGITMSIGSFGQFVMLPGALHLIDGIGWAETLLVFSAVTALIVPLALGLNEKPEVSRPLPGETASAAFRTAMASRDFWLLSLGFFVCGFQVVFIALHLPAFLTDQGLPLPVASTVLALIGLFNILGTLAAGQLGGHLSKPWLLASIYLARALAIAAFVLLPITAGSAYVFGVLIGLLWLSTVPLTNGVVATLFGVRNMAMLGGLVFLARQLGSFLGGWLGGIIYDRLGSYDVAWGLAIGLSLIAALINIPIREQAVAGPETDESDDPIILTSCGGYRHADPGRRRARGLRALRRGGRRACPFGLRTLQLGQVLRVCSPCAR